MSVLSVGAVSSEVVLARTFRERMVGPTWRRLTGDEALETAYRRVVPVAAFLGGWMVSRVARGAPVAGIVTSTCLALGTHLLMGGIGAWRRYSNYQAPLDSRLVPEPLLLGTAAEEDQKNLRAFVARRAGMRGFTGEVWDRISKAGDSETLTATERAVLLQVGTGVEALSAEGRAIAREHVRGMGHYLAVGLSDVASTLPMAAWITWAILNAGENPSELRADVPGLGRLMGAVTCSFVPDFFNAGRISVLKGLGSWFLAGVLVGEMYS